MISVTDLLLQRNYHVLYLITQNNWPSSLSAMGQFFYILILVAFVALLAYYSTKLLSSARSGKLKGVRRNLELLESLGVGVQAMVQLVRAGEKYLLIGVTKEQVTLLAELDESMLVRGEDNKVTLNNSFDKLVWRFMHKDKSMPDTSTSTGLDTGSDDSEDVRDE